MDRMAPASGRAPASEVNSSSGAQRLPVSMPSKNTVLLLQHRSPATTCFRNRMHQLLKYVDAHDLSFSSPSQHAACSQRSAACWPCCTKALQALWQ